MLQTLHPKNKPARAAPTTTTTRWWFILGREPLLSAAELFSVLRIDAKSVKDVCEYTPPILRVSGPLSPPAGGGVTGGREQQLMTKLGGTIKIGEELTTGITEKELLDAMLQELKTIHGKIHFGISWYGDAEAKDEEAIKNVSRWGKAIKKQLKDVGLSARYVFKDELTLSSVTVEKNGLVEKGREFLVSLSSAGERARGEVSYALAITKAIQPFKEFSARDYGRPGRDDISGMLPPKLALMMVNLAGVDTAGTLLDPFCGSGTILTEALLLGYTNLIGSDVSEKAVADTQNNIKWLKQNYSLLPIPYSLNLFQSDVTSLNTKLPSASVDAIVTEPYLGPPLKGTEKIEQVKKTALELNSLYFRAFREFKTILKPGSIVVFIFPRFLVDGEWVTISNRVIPDIQKLGFTGERLLPEDLDLEPFVLYYREGQRVGREIWRFRLE